MTDHTIEIGLHQNEHIYYVPSILNAKRGDRVRWASNCGSFAVCFPGGSPFQGRDRVGTIDFLGIGKEGSLIETQFASIPDDAPHRLYHYHVALRLGDGRILLDSSSPGVKV